VNHGELWNSEKILSPSAIWIPHGMVASFIYQKQLDKKRMNKSWVEIGLTMQNVVITNPNFIKDG